MLLALLSGCAPAAPPEPVPLIPTPRVSEDDAEFYDLLEGSAPTTIDTAEGKATSKAFAKSSCEFLDYIDSTMEDLFAMVAEDEFEYEKSQIVAAGIHAYCPQHLYALKVWADSQ